MNERIYRFRNCENLINNKELEEGYFYFADKEQLNDPMEGYINFFWQGDKIAWLGLFKNYVWQLYRAVTLVPTRPPMKILENLFLTRTEIMWKDTKLSKHRKDIESIFSKYESVQHMAELLSDKKFSILREELSFLLFTIHNSALKCILEYIDQFDFTEYFEWLNKMQDEMNSIIDNTNFDSIVDDQVSFNALSYVVKKTMEEMSLLFAINHTSQNTDEENLLKFIFCEFPYNYVKQIPKLAFANSYCVSFTQNIDNPSLWGYYANSHSGVALIFDYKENEKVNLDWIKSRDKKEQVSPKLTRVIYDKDSEPINFFLTLGHLFGDERKHWLIDNEVESEVLSQCKDDSQRYGEWYYQKLSEYFIYKNRTWKIENELRLVVNDDWNYYGDSEYRKFKYDFKRLQGIVFGTKTSYENKIKILELLKNKCAKYGRNEFEIYAAYFNDRTKKIEFQRQEMVEKNFFENINN